MGALRPLGTGPDGIQEFFEYDDSTGTCRIHWTAPDVSDHLDANKALYNEPDLTWSEGRDMRLVASIPTSVQMIWLEKYGVRAWDKGHKAAVARLLNDPEWRHLRTAPGHIGNSRA